MRRADADERRAAPGGAVLVTGANSGIGAAAVGALLERGATVIATVRSGEAAAEVRSAHPDAHRLVVEQLDLTDEAAARRVIDRCRPSVIVNSAGDAVLGAVMDTFDDAVRQQFESLVTGPIRLARLAAPHQRDRGGGRVVNISSTLAENPLPMTAWYAGSKAALDVVSDVLRLELQPYGIEVVRVVCGPVRTPAWDAAPDEVASGEDDATETAKQRWADLADRAEPAFADPEAVGELIADAALDPRPKAVYRIGPGSKVGALLTVVPRRLREIVLGSVFGLRGRSPR